MRELPKAVTALLVVGLISLASAVSGCIDPPSNDGSASPINQCSHDLDCEGSGGVCDLERQACVEQGDVDEAVVLLVTETGSTASSVHYLEPNQLSTADSTTVLVEELVQVQGLVLDQRRDFDPPVPARVTFRPQHEFDGLAAEPTYAEAVSVVTRTTAEPFNYQLHLPPGTYDVVVDPTLEPSEEESVLPYYPLRSTAVVPFSHESQTSTPVTQINLAYPLSSWLIQGVVRDALGEPTEGVQVYAYDPESEQRISNVAVTVCPDGEEERDPCGAFSLAVPPDTTVYRLRLQGTDMQPLIPIIDRGDYPIEGAPEGGSAPIERDVELPPLESAVLVEAVVEGHNRAGVEEPLSGANLVFRSTELSGTGTTSDTFEARGTTDEQGNVVGSGGLGLRFGPGIWLLPGTYQVTISPPSGEHASGMVGLTVAHPEDGSPSQREFLAVGSRVVISGSLVTPNGTSVAQVRVEASGEHGSAFETLSDSNGRFWLPVDPGRYDIVLATPSQSDLPWTHVSGLSAYQDVNLPVVLDWGIPTGGQVLRNSSDEPLQDAVIEAFVSRMTSDGQTELVRIGRARTNGQGDFHLLIPTTGLP